MEGVVVRDVFAERLKKPGRKRPVDLVAVRPQARTQLVEHLVRLWFDRFRLAYSMDVIGRVAPVDVVNGVQKIEKARDLSSDVL